MYRLSDNYFHRKCYFKREQVPTQTVMKDIMGESLASVYFKSMNYNLKILAGLEPPLAGGGVDWYQPPTEQLAGRAVLTPVDIKQLKLMGFDGLNKYGEIAKEKHFSALKAEKRQALDESDINWRKTILEHNRQQYEIRAKAEAQANSAKLRQALEEFEMMYRTSVTKIEEMVMDAARTEIKRIQGEAYDYMNKHYAELLNYQATKMYNEYEKKLNNEKLRQKFAFKKGVESIRTLMGTTIHDINYEKHLAIEKLRHFLRCQNLACQVYVALKEKEEFGKEVDVKKHEHMKKMQSMKEKIQVKDFEINLEKEQHLKRQEFNLIWKKKICHIVKKFQCFVEYCLKLLPQHAEFFINMEKLMMMQLAEAVENPSTESIIEPESGPKTPVPRPHPFYLVCGKGYKPKLDQALCPEHCTSSASQLPVIVINKRCIYAACDNMEMFTDKLSRYVYGNRGDDDDVADEHNYEFDVPVKYTSSTHLQELKLESSLMQVLQQELPNIRKLPVDCCVCKIPYCFCSPIRMSRTDFRGLGLSSGPQSDIPDKPPPPGKKLTKASVLQLQREPKWESYLEYVESKKCRCAKTAKKHLQEHLPPYMRKMSPYDAPELPNYEPCPIEGIKRMVKKARGFRSPPPTPAKTPSRTREIATQYSDQELEFLCNCFSDTELSKLLKLLKGTTAGVSTHCDVVDGALSDSSFMDKTVSTFATDRAFSVRRLLDDDSELKEIFQNSKCEHFEK